MVLSWFSDLFQAYSLLTSSWKVVARNLIAVAPIWIPHFEPAGRLSTRVFGWCRHWSLWGCSCFLFGDLPEWWVRLGFPLKPQTKGHPKVPSKKEARVILSQVVVLDVTSNTQRFFEGHTNDVKCLAAFSARLGTREKLSGPQLPQTRPAMPTQSIPASQASPP